MKGLLVEALAFLLERVRGRQLNLDSRADIFLVMRHAFSKGIPPLLRGFLKRVFFCRVEGLLFIGCGVKILCPSLLKTGKNLFLGDYCYIDCLSVAGVSIGNNVTIREFGWLQISSGYSNLGDSVIIGNSNYFGPRCIIGAAAPIMIGNDNQFGANLSLIAENHVFSKSGLVSEQGVRRAGINIGSGCWFGNNVTVLDGVTIGDGVVIGAGSVVTKSVPSGAVAYGVPARVAKMRAD